ncbi:hypothetical protein D9611_005882 [Ephemerocybe angulata]|uniref:Uncharacterized protein n=1 Tax=Ephemerocybe angulata TaxID=980116 RepID=A0A8H5CFS4_9AGAR|nr:hypothetical protein D9611_005882 [Tulosesus angulatus]
MLLASPSSLSQAPEIPTRNQDLTSWLQSAVALNAAATSSPPTLPLPYVARYQVLTTVTTSPKRTLSITDAATLKTCR